MPKVLAFAIHNTAPWWTYLMRNLEFAEGVVFSDIRGEGDFDIVDSFYAAMKANDEGIALSAYGTEGCDDIIRRCRVLRNMARPRALAMIGGMHSAISEAFDRVGPDLVMGLTIDRYTSDVAARVAESRGISFLEMTTSIIPDEVMFMKRGVLQPLWSPKDDDLEKRVKQVYSPDFVPNYVGNSLRFSRRNFFKIVAYFEARGLAFNAMRFLKRDRFNLHYLDAQRNLDHKVRVSDIDVLTLLDADWHATLESTPVEKRVFLGLQLYPEASMDYWLKSADMLDHARVVLHYCDVLATRGYQVFIKDHPLQFGFRKRQLMKALAQRPNVTLVPYEIPAQTMISLCSTSLTLTGTIGFQAALAGLRSIVSDPYYSTDEHYMQVRRFDDIETVPDQIAAFEIPADMDARRRELMRKLTGGSVPGDYFTFRRFDAQNPSHRQAIAPLVKSFRDYLPNFLKVASD
jgi:hypothetical protein